MKRALIDERRQTARVAVAQTAPDRARTAYDIWTSVKDGESSPLFFEGSFPKHALNRMRERRWIQSDVGGSACGRRRFKATGTIRQVDRLDAIRPRGVALRHPRRGGRLDTVRQDQIAARCLPMLVFTLSLARIFLIRFVFQGSSFDKS